MPATQPCVAQKNSFYAYFYKQENATELRVRDPGEGKEAYRSNFGIFRRLKSAIQDFEVRRSTRNVNLNEWSTRMILSPVIASKVCVSQRTSAKRSNLEHRIP